MLNSRRPNDYCINTYPLSKKIYCGSCGSVFRRKTQNDKTTWVCRNHDGNASCSAERINEQPIYTAFVSLFNKLKQNYKYILIPLLKHLQMLDSRDKSQNIELSAIQQKILSLKEQNYLLTKLKSQNMIDDIMFNEQFAVINKKINDLKKEVLRYNIQKNSGAEDISRLIDILKDNDFLTEFNQELFNNIIIKITANIGKNLTFHIIGGLELGEKLYE